MKNIYTNHFSKPSDESKKDEYILKNQNELNFDFEDKALKSTIKKLICKDKKTEVVNSINRFSEEINEIFSKEKMSDSDQY